MSKLKLNVLDYVIIFIVIAILLVGTFLFTRVNKTQASLGTPVTLEFTVEVKDLTEVSATAFADAVGKQVVYGVKNSDYGEITDVVIEPYKRLAKDIIKGEYFWDTYPDKYQALVTIRTEAYENSKFFVGNTEELRVGVKMPFSGGGVASPDGFIVKLEKTGGEQ
ncbi:MAG: DUF4330 family protein [Clostridia bacterium]|nr:DUF4330 family protein [Clostridia bacterium]